jgi:hypothetical protein
MAKLEKDLHLLGALTFHNFLVPSMECLAHEQRVVRRT